MIAHLYNNRKGFVSEEKPNVAVKHNGRKRYVSVIKVKVGGIVRVVWEYIRGYVLFRGGDYCVFKDGAVEKFKDQ